MLSVAAFITFFSISLLMGTVFTSSVFSGIFGKTIDPPTQAKIYNFLRKDLDIQREMSKKFDATDRSRNVLVFKEYYEMREKLDTSDLPEDFRDAWEKKILSEVEWIGFMFHLKNFNHLGTIETKAEKEIADEKTTKSRLLDDKFVAVAKRYGIKFDANNNLIEKK